MNFHRQILIVAIIVTLVSIYYYLLFFLDLFLETIPTDYFTYGFIFNDFINYFIISILIWVIFFIVKAIPQLSIIQYFKMNDNYYNTILDHKSLIEANGINIENNVKKLSDLSKLLYSNIIDWEKFEYEKKIISSDIELNEKILNDLSLKVHVLYNLKKRYYLLNSSLKNGWINDEEFSQKWESLLKDEELKIKSKKIKSLNYKFEMKRFKGSIVALTIFFAIFSVISHQSFNYLNSCDLSTAEGNAKCYCKLNHQRGVFSLDLGNPDFIIDFNAKIFWKLDHKASLFLYSVVKNKIRERRFSIWDFEESLFSNCRNFHDDYKILESEGLHRTIDRY